MLELVEASGLATIQDVGRRGWRRFGVPLAGPMDAFACEAANRLVGNEASPAALEIGAGDFVFRAQSDCLLAIAGAGYQLSINDWDFQLWGSYFVRGGWWIRLARAGGFGMWAYLATPGGFDCPPVLGSRSTYARGHFGGLDGRPLQPGDVLHSVAPSHFLMEGAARTLPEDARPRYGAAPTLEVLLGPQAEWFFEDELGAFFSGSYRVTAASDRMGYRLAGPALHPRVQSDLISEGMTVGSIQVPPDGQPIAMMADSATTGGYPKIACITTASLPLLAQCTPGRDEVRFRRTAVDEAQQKYRSMMSALRRGIIEEEL